MCATRFAPAEAAASPRSSLQFDADITEGELLREIERLNADESIDGFIVQLPLPSHIDEHRVVEAIDPRKDVDGFHPMNVGRMALGLPAFVSATPLGILTLLRHYSSPQPAKSVS